MYINICKWNWLFILNCVTAFAYLCGIESSEKYIHFALSCLLKYNVVQKSWNEYAYRLSLWPRHWYIRNRHLLLQSKDKSTKVRIKQISAHIVNCNRNTLGLISHSLTVRTICNSSNLYVTVWVTGEKLMHLIVTLNVTGCSITITQQVTLKTYKYHWHSKYISK